LTGGRISNPKFYNLNVLLMRLVVRKQRLLCLLTLLIKDEVTLEEILEIIGIAHVMGGILAPAR
jgi:hypothetical protein